MASVASPDPDIMFYHQSMNEPDHEQFRRSVQKEIQDHKNE